ncbi:site-specific integrase [Amniculibacterium aquaticum]|uniref:site-specific integrase n=1 Tax=Amniculibacterium aquaticum TaxID=2479858 RepID=UPI000F5AC01A|nr:site-specific integrase [Amniculibacterium aquaticum]
MNIAFEYRSKKDLSNIEVRLTYKEGNAFKSIRSQLQFKVTKNFWEECKSNKKFRDTEKVNLKTELDEHLKVITDYLLKESNNTKSIDKDWLNNALINYYNPKKIEVIPSGLLDYFDYYLGLREFELKSKLSSWKKWSSIRNMIGKFQSIKKQKYDILNVDEQFVKDWTAYGLKLRYAPETIKRNFTFIKTVCVHARTKGVPTSLALDKLQVRLADEVFPKIYLSFDELKKIKNTTYTDDYLDNARDWLLISCYTGQRVSDFLKFTSSMIRVNDTGKFIDLRQQKTGKNVTAPILPQVEEILRKRNGEFPRKISDQRYNEYIKEVCKQAGIDTITRGKKAEVIGKGEVREIAGEYPKYELITSHCGRRSFATHFYGKMKNSEIMNVTGHSSENMLLVYIGKTSKETTAESYQSFVNASK